MNNNYKLKFLVLGNDIKYMLNNQNNIEFFGINLTSHNHSVCYAYKKIMDLKPDAILIEESMLNSKEFKCLKELVKSNIHMKMLKEYTTLPENFLIKDVVGIGMVYNFNMQYLGTHINEFLKVIIQGIENDSIDNNSDMDLEIEVTNIIQNLGIPAHIKGYCYLRESIILSVNDIDALDGVTKMLYPSIARKFKTTSSRVERSIKHAIEVCWSRGNLEFINSLCCYSAFSKGNYIPTNSEFIAIISDKLRLNLKYNKHL